VWVMDKQPAEAYLAPDKVAQRWRTSRAPVARAIERRLLPAINVGQEKRRASTAHG